MTKLEKLEKNILSLQDNYFVCRMSKCKYYHDRYSLLQYALMFDNTKISFKSEHLKGYILNNELIINNN